MQRRLFELLRRVVPTTPPELAAPVAVVAGGVAFRAAHGMREASLHNLSRLLDLPEDHRKVRRASLGAFCTLARNYVDMLRLTSLTAEQVRQRTAVVDFEHLLEAQARGKGVLIVTAHIGNIDWGGQALIVRGAQCAVLTERVEPAWLMDFFIEERGHFGGEVVPFSPGVIPRLQRLLRDGVAVGIACDWDMQGTGLPVQLPGFRSTLSIPAGVALLARRSKAPLIPVWSERLPDGRIRSVVEPEVTIDATGDLRTDMALTAQAIAARMLPFLRARARQWVLFHPVWQPDGCAR